MGLGPPTAAAPAPGWGGPWAPGTERAGPPPSSRALGGRPGTQADSPAGGPASPAQAAKARPEQMDPSCWLGPISHPARRGWLERVSISCRKDPEPGWGGKGMRAQLLRFTSQPCHMTLATV